MNKKSPKTELPESLPELEWRYYSPLRCKESTETVNESLLTAALSTEDAQSVAEKHLSSLRKHMPYGRFININQPQELQEQ